MTCIFDPEALSGLGKDQRLVFITPQTYDGQALGTRRYTVSTAP